MCLELPQDDANQVIRLLLKTAMEVANGKDWKAEARSTPDDNIATDDDGEEKVDSRDKVRTMACYTHVLWPEPLSSNVPGDCPFNRDDLEVVARC